MLVSFALPLSNFLFFEDSKIFREEENKGKEDTCFAKNGPTGRRVSATILCDRVSVMLKTQYGTTSSRDRLPLLCRGASGSVQVPHTRCLTVAWKLYFLVLRSWLLARRMSSERRGERILFRAGDNACLTGMMRPYLLATNHNAATGERGYHHISKRFALIMVSWLCSIYT